MWSSSKLKKNRVDLLSKQEECVRTRQLIAAQYYGKAKLMFFIIVSPNSSYDHNVTFPVFGYAYRNTYYKNVVIRCELINGLIFDEKLIFSQLWFLGKFSCQMKPCFAGYKTAEIQNGDFGLHPTISSLRDQY